MELRLKKKFESFFFKQKNILISFSVCVLFSNIVLVLLLSRGESVVLVPLNFQSDLKISRQAVSSSYLEEMALFYSRTILDQTPESFGYTAQFLTKYLAPESRNEILQQLIDREVKYKSDHLSTSFVPNNVEVNQDGLTVNIEGSLLAFIGNEKLSEDNQIYVVKFVLRNGMLLLSEFLKKEDKNV